MTTATKSTAAPLSLSFEQRLALTRSGMDALLAHRHGLTLADARAHLSAAEDEAEMINMDEHGRPRFESHPVLARAGQILNRRGWCQGYREGPSGAVCAERAIEIAANGQTGAQWDALVELMNRIAADTGEALSVPTWNDSRRDRSEVMRLVY
jgi:hypothetical protein